MSANREPWMKFYFGDWRTDPRLKMVSRAARSLWLDMLSLMHNAEPYGFLLVDGVAPSQEQLARLVGDSERDVRKWLNELVSAGVPSIVGHDMPHDVLALVPPNLPGGTFLSRRMLRDRDHENANGRHKNVKYGGQRWQ